VRRDNLRHSARTSRTRTLVAEPQLSVECPAPEANRMTARSRTFERRIHCWRPSLLSYLFSCVSTSSFTSLGGRCSAARTAFLHQRLRAVARQRRVRADDAESLSKHVLSLWIAHGYLRSPSSTRRCATGRPGLSARREPRVRAASCLAAARNSAAACPRPRQPLTPTAGPRALERASPQWTSNRLPKLVLRFSLSSTQKCVSLVQALPRAKRAKFRPVDTPGKGFIFHRLRRLLKSRMRSLPASGEITTATGRGAPAGQRRKRRLRIF
jgi:hypothetical protein